MARNQNNRGGNRTSRSNNNNPEGRNQYNSGLMGMARERPATAAAVAAGTVVAGVFLWSKRAQISDQISQLSDQIGEWSENMNSGGNREFEMAERDTSGSTGSSGKFTSPGSTAVGSRGTTAKSSPNAGSGSVVGSGTISGGAMDSGPSGRNPA